MADSKNPDMQHERGEPHGNKSYGLAKMELQLRKGQPFDDKAEALYHYVLADWGYADAELTGVRGDFIRLTARRRTFLHVLDGAQAMAARSGDVASFLQLEARYGTRFDQVARHMLTIREWQEQEANVLDYEVIQELESAQG